MFPAVAWLVLTSLLVSACVTRPAPLDLPAETQKEEKALLTRVKLYEDPLLDEYLARVGERLGPGFTFRVLRDPTLNAFAMPDRRIYLHTGLLARLDNEAQLATIIGHEMTHAAGGQAVARRPDLPLEPVVLSPAASAILGLRLGLMATAAISGHGRALERDADRGGLERLVGAGYDPREAPRAFARLRAEAVDGGALEVFFFGNEARLTERIETTQALVETQFASAPPAVRDTEDFAARMRPVARENAADDIRAGRFAVAQRQLERVLAATPEDPIAHTYLGDLYRLQAQRSGAATERQTLAQRALASYEKAVELDAAAPGPYRQLGFLYYQQQDTAKARAAFEKYLALSPDASDARRIEGYLGELAR